MKLWIARDKDNSLWLFEEKPHLNHFNRYADGNINHSRLYSALFPEITFENSPQQVELKLINENEALVSKN